MNQELTTFLWNSNLTNPSILDLGFCSPTQFFCLFKEFKCKLNKTFLYTGVDLCDAFNVFHHNCPHITLKAEYEIESSDWVKSFNGLCCQNLAEDEDFLIDEDTFTKHFKFFFKTDILDFLLNTVNTQYYNAIVLSNILHKLNHSNAELVFSKCLSLMNKDSIIYVSVLAEKYENALPGDKLYSLDRYLTMKEKVNVLWCEENVRTHFRFVGKITNDSAS